MGAVSYTHLDVYKRQQLKYAITVAHARSMNEAARRLFISQPRDVYKRQAEERAHILQGLLIALDNIDEVIRIIREMCIRDRYIVFI